MSYHRHNLFGHGEDDLSYSGCGSAPVEVTSQSSSGCSEAVAIFDNLQNVEHGHDGSNRPSVDIGIECEEEERRG